jgi:steroid delta-isomerase-like uncharacterized protein
MTVVTTDTNKATVRRIYADLINARRFELAGELVDADYAGPTGDRGTDGFVANVRDLVQGFPDIKFAIEDLVAEGDRVAARWIWEATHGGQFRAYAATGKHVTNSGIVIYQLRDGRIVRSWLETDRLGALQQIGAIA